MSRSRPLRIFLWSPFLGAAVALWWACLSPSVALAQAPQAIFLMPVDAPTGDSEVPETLRRQAHANLRSLLAETNAIRELGDDGALAPELIGCVSPACAMTIAEQLEADRAAVLFLWSGDSGVTAEVALVTAPGEAYRGSVELPLTARGPEVARGIERALAEARARLTMGPGPWLSLRGSPNGAAFHLRGGPDDLTPRHGALPDRIRIPGGGRLTVTIEAGGFAPETREIWIREAIDEEVLIEFDLAELNEESAVATDGIDAVWLASGIGVGAVGVAALGLGIGTFTVGSTEVHLNDGVFIEESDAVAGVLWLTSGAALSGLAVWLVLQAFANDEDEDQDESVALDPTGAIRF